jgi:protein-S-isoprenylcysteine O-methyltransferase Ste14
MTERLDPQEQLKVPTIWQAFGTLSHKQLWGNLAVHLFILIPAAVFMAYMGRRLDMNWGWPQTPGEPWNYVISIACFMLGGFIVWYSYGVLHLLGKGSPGSHMGYTTQLVTVGIFSWIRHPSVVGKLIGVVGLGFLMRSLSFLVLIIPVLLIYSYFTNIYIQEKTCIKHFGEDYLRYKSEVPMFIPRWSRIKRHFEERGR